MEITTKLNGRTLTSINQIWSLLIFSETVWGKIDKDILEYTAARMLKKQISRMGKNPKKDFTITLKYFEAATLERYLRRVLEQLDITSLEFNQLNTYCNELHQKTQ